MAIRLKVQDGASVTLNARGGDAALFRVDDYVQIITGDLYEGPYEVTPRVYEQSLDTGRKYMRDDVTVHEIPVTMTSNPEGGLTVLIG